MSLPRYAEYKDSGVEWLGEVPFNWQSSRVKSHFLIGRGRVISQEELHEDGQYPVFSSQTKDDGCLGFIHTFDFDCSQLTWTTDGANAGTVFLRQGKHNCTNVCGTLQNRSDEVGQKFALYFLQYATQFYKRPDTNGAKIMNGEMAEVALLLPSKEEQTAIATFLDRETAKIDGLIAEQEKLIALLAEKRQATISRAVTKGLNPAAPMKDSGVAWLGEVPAHWNVHRTRRHLQKNLSNGIFKKKEEFGQGTLLVNVFDIYRDDFMVDFLSLDRVNCSDDEKESYEVIAGDVFFVRSSLKKEGIAAVAVAGECLEAVVFECHLIQGRFSPESCLGRFVSYLFNAAQYRAHMVRSAKVTTMTTIDQEAILSTPMLVPPQQEQSDIVTFLETEIARLDELTAEATRGIALLKERRSALISAAVTGKIDVRHLAEAEAT